MAHSLERGTQHEPSRRASPSEGRSRAAASKAAKPRTPVSPNQRSFFANLSKADRELFLARCKLVRFKRGEILFLQGARHTANFVINTGIIRSYYISPTGKEMILPYQSPGDLMGGPDFLDDNARHIWSAQAADDTTLYRISGKDFCEVAVGVPGIARAVIEALSYKLKWESILIQTLSTRSVHDRLAYLLLKLSENFGEARPEGIVIAHDFSHADLASMIGTTRQWVSTTLGCFRRKGLISIGKRSLVILDKAALGSTIQG